jgi:hypothetical protein
MLLIWQPEEVLVLPVATEHHHCLHQITELHKVLHHFLVWADLEEVVFPRRVMELLVEDLGKAVLNRQIMHLLEEEL